MKKQILTVTFLLFVVCLLCPAPIHAQPDVELLLDPDIRTIALDAEKPEAISIIVRTGVHNAQFDWQLTGAGKLEGEGPGVLYVPPQSLDIETTQAEVNVTVTDAEGQDTTASVTFTLETARVVPAPVSESPPAEEMEFSLDDLEMEAEWYESLHKMEAAFEMTKTFEDKDVPPVLKHKAWTRFLQFFEEDNPVSERDNELRRIAGERIAFWQTQEAAAPTPTPVPLPTTTPIPHPTTTPEPTAIPTPTPTPTPSQIEQLLKQGEEYIEKDWLTTGPNGKNAFDTYKRVLEIEPANANAKHQLYAIMARYKAWGDAWSKEHNQTKAKTFYDRYLTVAEYLLNTLGEEQVRQDYEEIQAALKQIKEHPKTWKDPITGMEFMWIPAGCFKMGCVSGSSQCAIDEKPVHEVCLDGYWMGKYEVTQAQWKTLKGGNPSKFKGDNNPVENVSWYDVQDFILKLNYRAGKELFRLPTEAEWEYAARAGTQSVYSFDNNVARLGNYAWYSGNSINKTHPVGQLKSNNWGLYDMLGNVGEWCQDVYNINAYQEHSRQNPIYTGSGAARINRGKNWFSSRNLLRSAYRGSGHPGTRSMYLGFRLVREAE